MRNLVRRSGGKRPDSIIRMHDKATESLSELKVGIGMQGRRETCINLEYI